MLKLKFDLDPSLPRVVMIGVLLFIINLAGNIVVITEGGDYPTELQWITMLCLALITICAYFLEFLKKEEGA